MARRPKGDRITMAQAWEAFENTCIPPDAPPELRTFFRVQWRRRFAEMTRAIQHMHRGFPELMLDDVDAAMSAVMKEHEEMTAREVVAMLTPTARTDN